MFRKLRNHFIWYTMGLLTLVFAALFFSIYISVENSAQKQIEISLQMAVEKPEHYKKAENPLLAASISVKLESDTNEIISITSLTDIEESSVETVISEIIGSGSSTGFVTMDGTRYAYLFWPGNEHNNVALVSSSQYDQTMRNLLITLLSAGTGALALVFLLSLFFSNWTIKPIRTAFEKQQQFVADASHELRTPLTIISTNLDVVKSNPNKTVDSQRKWISYIDDQTERMARLIDDMLNLARLDDPAQARTVSQVNASELVKKLLMYFEAQFYEKGIALSSSIAENVQLIADSPALERLTGILLDNALKYTSAGGRVRVNLSAEKSKIQLVVSNTHDGLDAMHVSHLFDRFYRVSQYRSQQAPGYGLGLAIAKSIVEQHKGKINARPTGEWIDFIAEIPLI